MIKGTDSAPRSQDHKIEELSTIGYKKTRRMRRGILQL